MNRLEGKTAIITGASSGIGKSTALLFAAEGAAALILADRNEPGLKTTEAEIKLLYKECRIITIKADVSKSQDCTNLVEEGVKFAGGLDILVNAAGIAVFDQTVESTSEELWDYVMNVNLKSVYLISKRAIPYLRNKGGGSIINLGSPHAFLTGELVAPYAASKGGVVALSRQMAFDLAKDRIRVNVVIPGATDTPMLSAHAERQGTTMEALGFYSDQTKIGRISQPDEVARGIVWLASAESSFVNATSFFIDGGLTARL